MALDEKAALEMVAAQDCGSHNMMGGLCFACAAKVVQRACTIDAIKLVRMVSGMGLRESKAWVDRATNAALYGGADDGE